MLTDRDDIKIFILYLMNSIGFPLEYGELHDLSVQDGFITSFEFLEAYDELIKNGNAVKMTNEKGKTVVSITDNGKHIAETLNDRLLLSVREKSLKSALRMLSFNKRGTKVDFDAVQLPHGRYEFRCSIKDNRGEILNLTAVMENKKQLDKTMYNFDSRPEFIYKGILALLAGEADYLLN